VRIWIDADATPRPVKEIVFRASKRLGIETVHLLRRDRGRDRRWPPIRGGPDDVLYHAPGTLHQPRAKFWFGY
jgi:hypothetical protein